MRVILYARVSTEEQAEHGYGLDAQIAELEREANHRRWDVVETIRDEGQSAKSLDRPGLRRALALISIGEADGIAVAKLDRLTRSIVDFGSILEWLDEIAADLVALDIRVDTSGPAGRMLTRILVVIAEWEREVIGARTKAGMAQLRAQGKPTGRPSVADRPELAARIRRMREHDGMTFQAIADQLTAEGVPTARGAATWRPSSVQAAAGQRRRPPRRKPTELPSTRDRLVRKVADERRRLRDAAGYTGP